MVKSDYSVSSLVFSEPSLEILKRLRETSLISILSKSSFNLRGIRSIISVEIALMDFNHPMKSLWWKKGVDI